jgi:phosphatidylethanolamine/phosphatidyl-N-methylethanolamine N-methyltransferase
MSSDTRAAAPDWLLFMNKFLRHGTAIASLAPSSRWLARAMVRDLDFGPASRVVELGAGTGAVTAELLKRAGDCRPVIIERDPDFCRRLRQRFPEADIVEADALDLERLLDERGIEQIDYLLSGLPLPSFPADVRDRLMSAIRRRLKPGGSFRQLTLMPWVYARLYRSYFADVAFHLVPLNLPPGGVYICRAPAHSAVP